MITYKLGKQDMVFNFLIRSLDMKVFITIVITLITKITYSQVIGEYHAKGSNYFPTLLCMLDSTAYLYWEDMGGGHAYNQYYEIGTYEQVGDTIRLNSEYAGFYYNDLPRQRTFRMAYLKGVDIFLLSDDGKTYLKLKRKRTLKCCMSAKLQALHSRLKEHWSIKQ